jgi:hypothetical protein
MSRHMNHLRRLRSQFSILNQTDPDGYLGRQCPISECRGYFKITLGTGVTGRAPSVCPYCGHQGETTTFATQEQLAYARSVVIRKVSDAVFADLKSLEFEHKPQGGFGIGLSMKVSRTSSQPIRYYNERELETHVVCDRCTLRYAIYGVFAWCPDCGVHNSMQILTKNLELAGKELVLATLVDKELADHLVGDALQAAVSAFDGFGREICTRKGADIQFQNLVAARRRVQHAFGIDFADVLTQTDWELACRVFQKRHLLAHRMGVIDADYIQRAHDPSAVVGRMVAIAPEEVASALTIVECVGRRLFDALLMQRP